MNELEIRKEELESLVTKYYKEELDFDGKATISSIHKFEDQDEWYESLVKINGEIELAGSKFKVERLVGEKTLKDIIKFYFESNKEKIEGIDFNLSNGLFKNTKIVFKQNVKTKGEDFMKNLKVYNGCLIVVDMVNGFVREGVLHDEKISKIVPRQIELIKEAKHDGKLIVFIKDTHDKDAVEFIRFGNTKHCVENDREADLIDELKEFENLEDTISIPKNSTCFMEAPLFRELMKREKNMNEFDIVGCCTDICLVNGAIGLANYLDQNNRAHIIRVHEDAIATYNEENRKEYVEAAKILMKQQGIELVKKGR